ncbi:MarR family transcriptional regulator, partial [Staphylococcus aureus]
NLIYPYVDAQETRIKNIWLTTSGIKHVEAFTSIFDEMEQTLVSQLSEEENELMKANLTKMLSSLQ